ncbi:MAG: hypothetical protein L6M37_06920, partial [Candidatus Methylarchaceae archaeon HK02M1]|nr:hypothetical protein [Candidatus Methylarchaceae archaeon HK02M1]
MSSNRNLSIAVISILILSAFTTVQLSLAEVTPAPPFITVNPSSVRPGQTVKVEGWNFPEGKTLDIYCD